MFAKALVLCGSHAISVTKQNFSVFFTDLFKKTGVHSANVTTSPQGKEL
jgi:hypothetical protein